MANQHNNDASETRALAAKAIPDAISRLQMTARECERIGQTLRPLQPEISGGLLEVAARCRELETRLMDEIIKRFAAQQ